MGEKLTGFQKSGARSQIVGLKNQPRGRRLAPREDSATNPLRSVAPSLARSLRKLRSLPLAQSLGRSRYFLAVCPPARIGSVAPAFPRFAGVGKTGVRLKSPSGKEGMGGKTRLPLRWRVARRGRRPRRQQATRSLQPRRGRERLAFGRDFSRPLSTPPIKRWKRKESGLTPEGCSPAPRFAGHLRAFAFGSVTQRTGGASVRSAP